MKIQKLEEIVLKIVLLIFSGDVAQQRPERLISRLRTVSVDDTCPKLTVTRQPKGPDGTRGFTEERMPRLAGVVEE